MRHFGLIGHPIGHSLSPKLFRAGYPGSEDTYSLIETDSFEEAISVFRRKYDAINVTAPFKADAFLCADTADETAGLLKAANLLVKEGAEIRAYNTDFTAASRLLEKVSETLSHGRPEVLITGCGGAGKSAALASVKLGLPTKVANRDFGKVKAFCNAIGNAEPLHLDSEELSACSFDILIHTLPVVTEGILNLNLKGRTVIEANYRDPGLKAACARCGSIYVPGTEWLVEQAAAGFLIMTGEHPDLQNLSKFRTQ